MNHTRILPDVKRVFEYLKVTRVLLMVTKLPPDENFSRQGMSIHYFQIYLFGQSFGGRNFCQAKFSSPENQFVTSVSVKGYGFSNFESWAKFGPIMFVERNLKYGKSKENYDKTYFSTRLADTTPERRLSELSRSCILSKQSATTFSSE